MLLFTNLELFIGFRMVHLAKTFFILTFKKSGFQMFPDYECSDFNSSLYWNGLKSGIQIPFDDRTHFGHLNTGHIWYSDPQCPFLLKSAYRPRNAFHSCLCFFAKSEPFSENIFARRDTEPIRSDSSVDLSLNSNCGKIANRMRGEIRFSS